MDTTGFFQYPGDEPLPTENPPGFLEDRDDEDWTLLLEHTETRLFRAGQDGPDAGGARPRALPARRRPPGRAERPGRPGQHVRRGRLPRRPPARGDGHRDQRRRGAAPRPRGVPRALSARRPDLGRAVLTDVSAILAARLRHASRPDRGVDGLMAAITFPNYTQIPSRLSLTAWRAIRTVVWIGALVVAGLLIAVPDTGLKVFWKGVIPALPLLFMVAPGVWRNICPLATSNQTPRLLGITKGLNPPKWLKEYGYVIADRRVRRLRDPAQGRPRRQRPAERAAAARRDDRRVRRRDGAQGQERLVLDASARCCRSSASTARRRSRSSATTTASRASAAPRAVTTSTRAPPTWPTSTTPTATGAATASSSSAPSRA